MTLYEKNSSCFINIHSILIEANRVRPHMSCNNLTPEAAHVHAEPLVKMWKIKVNSGQDIDKKTKILSVSVQNLHLQTLGG